MRTIVLIGHQNRVKDVMKVKRFGKARRKRFRFQKSESIRLVEFRAFHRVLQRSEPSGGMYSWVPAQCYIAAAECKQSLKLPLASWFKKEKIFWEQNFSPTSKLKGRQPERSAPVDAPSDAQHQLMFIIVRMPSNPIHPPVFLQEAYTSPNDHPRLAADWPWERALRLTGWRSSLSLQVSLWAST